MKRRGVVLEYVCGLLIGMVLGFMLGGLVLATSIFNRGAVAHARGAVIVDIHKLPDGKEVVTVIPAESVKQSAP